MAIKQITQSEEIVIETGVVESEVGSLAAAILGGDSSVELFQTEPNTGYGLGIPDLRYHWKVQSDLKNSNYFNLWSDGEYNALESGWIVTSLACRDMVKRSYLNEKKESRNEYAYRGTGETGERFLELLAMAQKDKDDKSIAVGLKYLVAICVDNVWTLASFNASKSLKDYTNFLLKAQFKNKIGFEINISDHTDNLERSGNDSRHFYLARNKFTQKEKVELQPSDLAAIAELVRNNERALKAFLEA